MSQKYKLAIVLGLAACLLSGAELMARGFGGGGARGGASRGGASMSRGGASASRGGASISRGGASASRGGSSFSRGGTSASRSGASFSRGGTSASRGSASISRGGASATRSSAAASRGGSSAAVRGGTNSVTGSRGGSVTVGGAAGAARGPAGGAAGKVGGVQVEGPGGRTATKGGASGIASGPGGTVAGSARGGSVSGSRGSVNAGHAHAAGRSFSTDAGFSKYKGGVTVRGSGGTTAARRTSSVTTAHRTRSVTTTSRRTHGTAVRRDVGVRYGNRSGWYSAGWYAKNPRAWRATGLTTAAVWTGASWNSLSSWWGPSYISQPVYYDYGNTIVYEGDTVYNGTEVVGTAEDYYTEASTIASAGEVKVAEDEEWTSLGVWGMVKGDQTESTNIIQLAVNKKGVIRGNHYNATTEVTQPIEGSVDQKTQRAAWTIGDNSGVVSETGIANLTHEETEMLIHYGADRTEQWSLVRLEEPEGTG